MLLGVSFVYAATGSLHLSQVGARPHRVADPRLATLAERRRRPHPRRLRLQDRRRPLPLLGARHLRRRAAAGRRLPLRGRQGGRLLRPDPGHRPGLPVVRGRLGPGTRRPRRAHHDRRQRRGPAPATPAARTAPYACSPGPPSARPATSWSRSPPPATPTTRRSAIGSTVAYALMYAAVNLGAFAVAALVGPYAAPPTASPTTGACTPPAPRRPRPRLLPALPGRAAAGHHRPLRQGHGLLRGRRRGPGLARRGHGRERRDRALLLPPVDGGPLPGSREGRRGHGAQAARPRGRQPSRAGSRAARRRHRARRRRSASPSPAPRSSSCASPPGAALTAEWPPPAPAALRPARPPAPPVRHHAPPGAACPARPTARAQGN